MFLVSVSFFLFPVCSFLSYEKTVGRWVEKRRTALEEMGSSLVFQLARLRFLCFLKVR